MTPRSVQYDMRKNLLVIVAVIVIAASACGVMAAYFRRHDRGEVARAEALAADLQKLGVGTSDYKAARAIAAMFGTVPYDNHWGTRDFTAGYFELCAYKITVNHKGFDRVLRHPFLRYLGLRDWSGTAQINVKDGIVQGFYFVIVYDTSDGQSRGIAVEENDRLPRDRAVQARISDSYSIQRNDVESPRGMGFDLESSLIPTSTSDERRRAWHLQLGCLSQPGGCGEICEVMPDAWRDFYDHRGHFDVEKYGSAYLFCNKRPI